MSATAAPLNPAPIREGGWRALHRFFSGLTPGGIGLVLVVCLLNALRRKVMDRPAQPIGEWLVGLLGLFGASLVVAVPITLAVVATYNHVSPRPWRRYPALAAAVVLSSLAGTALMLVVETLAVGSGGLASMPASPVASFLIGYWLRYALLASLFTAVYVYARVAGESIQRARDDELDRQRFDQQMDEARLQVLQAQIEPHFLFNTLATVRRLYHKTPESAVAMLDNLMRYLSVALPEMRSGATTLGRELSLVEAYLGIQKLRMGRRLAFEFDVPPALAHVPMPPMMLLTLVENAIKHGLNPLPEGGFIRITATSDRGGLRVQVADSGKGFVESSGAGTGLANIRARLAALHGRAARLDLGLNQPRGVTATLALPLPGHEPAGAR